MSTHYFYFYLPSTQHRDVVARVMRDYPDIEYTTVLVKDGLIPTVKADLGRQCIGISFCGAMASRRSFGFPVLHASVDSLDYLEPIRSAAASRQKFAVICPAEDRERVLRLCSVLGCGENAVVRERAPNLRQQLISLSMEGVSRFVGDPSVERLCDRLLLSCKCVRLSELSVRTAVENALALSREMENAALRSELLQLACDGASSALLLTRDDGELIYANSSCRELGLEQVRKLISPLMFGDRRENAAAIHQLNNAYYHISASRSAVGAREYCLYTLNRAAFRPDNSPYIAFEDLTDIPDNNHFLNSKKPSILSIISNTDIYANSGLPVLLTGPIGTEKTSVARFLHMKKTQNAVPFIHVHCNLLTPAMWKSFLPESDNRDLRNCTLFFENLHELSPKMQEELTIFLSYPPMLSNHLIISSSYADLQALITSGKFSPYLYQLLSNHIIRMPSLNERKEDIPGIVEHYISNLNEKYGKEIRGIEDDALTMLQEYRWDLNLKQLYRVVSRLVAACDSSMISAEAVSAILQESVPVDYDRSRLLPIDMTKTLEAIEREIIYHILIEEGDNQTAAAKRLGIGRSTLWRKLRI